MRSRPWKSEVAKFQLQKRVSELIGTFNTSESAAPASAEVKVRRRGSLQIEGELEEEVKSQIEEERRRQNQRELQEVKQLRRKSTSAILTSPAAAAADMSILSLTEILVDSKAANDKKEVVAAPEARASPVVAEPTKAKAAVARVERAPSAASEASAPSAVKTLAKKWDYFEIDHPKAISDKKLLQLKAKYQRRKTEATIREEETSTSSDATILDSEGNKRPGKKGPPARALSMPVVESGAKAANSLKLSIDPLTGVCLGEEDSGASSAFSSSEQSLCSSASSSSSSSDGGSSSRKSSRGSRRKSSHNLPEIQVKKNRLIGPESGFQKQPIAIQKN